MTRVRWWRWWCVLALALIAGFAGWLSMRDGSMPRAAALKAGEERGPRAASSPPMPAKPRSVRTAVKRPPAPDSAPVIEGVDVDKTEVCRGEEVIVTIRARATAHDENFLNYGALGNPDLVGPRFTLHPEESLGYGWMRVFARAGSGTSTVSEVPPVLVKDCDVPFKVSIDLERRASMLDRAWLSAHFTSAAGSKTTEPVEYTWDFGDGRTLTSSAANVEHSYEEREQTSAYSYYFVTVKARDASGHEARGTRSIRFVNLGFIPLVNEDRVVLFTAIDDRTPGQERVTLYHGAPFDVNLDRVTLKDTLADARDGGVVETREGDAASLLGFAHLPKGAGLAIRDLEKLRPSDAKAARIIEISGTAPGGKTVSGSFELMAKPRANAASDLILSTTQEAP